MNWFKSCLIEQTQCTKSEISFISSLRKVYEGAAHGRSRPEVGGAKCIDVYGSGGVSRPSLVLGNSLQNIIAIFDILRRIHNFYSLTMCS